MTFDRNNGTTGNRKSNVLISVRLFNGLSVRLPVKLANRWIDCYSRNQDKRCYICNRKSTDTKVMDQSLVDFV
jgi:hypothetical protein